MNTKIATLLVLKLLSPLSYGCPDAFFASKILEVNGAISSGQNYIKVEKVSDILKELYDPYLRSQGKSLKIEVDYSEQHINAYATRDDDDNPVIKITAGMIAHPKLDEIGLAVILCHEIGHYLGGEPKKLRGRSTKRSWSSAEGQADYYSTAVCLKNLILQDDLFFTPSVKNGLKDIVETQIKAICNSSQCEALSRAIYQVAQIYSETSGESGELSLLNTDPIEAFRTILDHPRAQCRLDTMIAGLLCPDNLSIGYEAQDWCSDEKFRRPKCWFNPNR